jgi:hypothetical protein
MAFSMAFSVIFSAISPLHPPAENSIKTAKLIAKTSAIAFFISNLLTTSGIIMFTLVFIILLK